MHALRPANVFFAVAQCIWFCLWVTAMIWAYAATDGTHMGRAIRAEVTLFRLHVASVLAMLYVLCDHINQERWIALVPLFVVQFVIGLFSSVEVGLYSENLSTMSPLWGFVVYGVGAYQLAVLALGIVYYSAHWVMLTREQRKANDAAVAAAAVKNRVRTPIFYHNI